MKPYFAFQWHITDICDQRCRHCYIYAENNGKEPESMSWPDMQNTVKICQDFCEYFGRRPYFYITGGDPIMHPDFWKLLECLHENRIPFSILGNPFHLTPEICHRLKELGCEKYQLSMDGMEQTHDWFRKPGSFRNTLEKIPMLNEAGLKSIVMMTISSKNIDEAADVYKKCIEAGVKTFSFGRYCPTSSEKSTGIDPKEYRAFLESMQELALKQSPDTTRLNKKDHLWRLLDYEKGNWKIPAKAKEGLIYEGCHCGNCHLTILPNGDVYTCRRVQNSKVGNIFCDDLKKIWLEDMEAYRDFSKFEKCSKCELLAWCRGCPAVACGSTQNFYAADPQCWKEIA